MPDHLLPLTYVEGRKLGLLNVRPSLSADEIQLPFEHLDEEYENFATWAKQNTYQLSGWITYHKVAPRIINSHNTFVPKHHVDEYLKQRTDKRLSRLLEIPQSDIAYAFDAFARRFQYHQILGSDTPYFSHPIRDSALHFQSDRELRKSQTQGWSWGRYLVGIIQHSRAPRDVGWVLNRVCRIRQLVREHDATWYALRKRPRTEQVELLTAIALDSDLPAKLKDSTVKRLKLGGLVVPGGKRFLAFIELNEGYIPLKLARIRVLKGHLVWPGLINGK